MNRTKMKFVKLFLPRSS